MMDLGAELDIPARAELYSSVEECSEPILAEVTGTLPLWLKGHLLRIGPAKFEWGDTKYNHWFDGDGMVHKFDISNGTVYYSSQFVRSQSYLLNQGHGRIACSNFATPMPPDPCQNIFSKFFSKFVNNEPYDNTNVSLYPIKERIFASTETAKLNRIDLHRLETVERVDFSKNMAGRRGWLPHPHIDNDGTVYNLSTVWDKGVYELVKVPPRKDELEDIFDGTEILSTISFNWKPSYYHSFGITDHYFILFNNPFTISFSALLMFMKMMNWAYKDMFHWDPNGHTQIIVVDKVSGKVVKRVTTEKLFLFHHVNAYEEDATVIVDVIGYRDASVIDMHYLHVLRETKLDTARWNNANPNFRRYKLTIDNVESADKNPSQQQYGRDLHPYIDICENVELPNINYQRYNGKKYKFAYCVNTSETMVTAGLTKLNVATKEFQKWVEDSCAASEPVFVERPGATDEDDGVVLSSVIGLRGKASFLLVLDAKTFKEIARASVPLRFGTTLHGIFVKT